MNFSRCWPCFLSLAFFLSSVFSATASEPQWVEIQSPHFSVVTDAGEKRGRDVAVRFEQMRAVFSSLLVKANVNMPVPLQIVAFRNGKELRQVVPLWHGKPIQVAGLFQSGQDRSFIMLDMSLEDPWKTVFHEYAHQLMNGNITAQVDPWFQEGFAEYFSTIEVDGKQAHVGKIPEYDYEILQQQGVMKISELFRVQQNSATYNESGDHRSVFYAESSMVMHYLYDNNLMPKLANYFTLKVDKGLPVDDAIQQSFGMSSAQFDRELRNYVSSGRFRYFVVASPTDIVKSNYAARPITQLDSRAIIADIHLHSPDYHDEASAEFQEILKADPNNAAAARGLGYAYFQAQNFDGAAEYFKRAAQLDSKDPRVHFYSALLMSRQGSFTDSSSTGDVVKELETAISLDPSFAEAYSLLAFAQARNGDSQKGLATMQKAVSLKPGDEMYHFNLAQMYLNNQQIDQAVGILQALSRSSNPEVAMRASQSLARTQAFQTARSTAIQRANIVRESPNNFGDSALESAGNIKGIDRDAAPSVSQQQQIQFLKGTLVSVDCSSAPSATLIVTSGKKPWTMLVKDSTHVLLMGADAFSCVWKQQRVAINYRATGDTTGDVVSIELQ
jgi:cytochrome c-type biogenesis protein CcmH/NrfG